MLCVLGMQGENPSLGVDAFPLHNIHAVPAVVSSVWFDAPTLLAVPDLLSLLPSLQHLLLRRALSRNYSLKKK